VALDARPSLEAIHEAAQKHPDLWAQAVAILARLAGNPETLKLDPSIAPQVKQMSYPELVALDRQLGVLEVAR
jgi:hypothetical protein